MQVGLERCRIEGEQHIRLVAGRQDAVSAELNLKCGHAEGRPGGRANLGGEIRQRQQVVVLQGDRFREFASEHLDAVARVAGEAHDGARPWTLVPDHGARTTSSVMSRNLLAGRTGILQQTR